MNSDKMKLKADRSDEAKHTQRVNATPSARRHALKQGVDLAEVAGKSNDVVRKEDIDQRQQQSSNKKQKRHKESARNIIFDTKQTSYS